jgi:hypothetical protein
MTAQTGYAYSTQVRQPGAAPEGGQLASSDLNSHRGLLVTNEGSPPDGFPIEDEYGFLIESDMVRCLHCRARGDREFWPEYKRRWHFQREHEWPERRKREARERAKAKRAHLDPDEPLPESAERRERRQRSRRSVAAREPRACRQCGGMFSPTDPRQAFCTAKCRKRYAYSAQVAKARASQGGGQVTSSDPSNDGASRVTKEEEPPPTCAQCGDEFEPRRTDQRFCTNACRQAAYRERQCGDADRAAS